MEDAQTDLTGPANVPASARNEGTEQAASADAATPRRAISQGSLESWLGTPDAGAGVQGGRVLRPRPTTAVNYFEGSSEGGAESHAGMRKHKKRKISPGGAQPSFDVDRGDPWFSLVLSDCLRPSTQSADGSQPATAARLLVQFITYFSPFESLLHFLSAAGIPPPPRPRPSRRLAACRVAPLGNAPRQWYEAGRTHHSLPAPRGRRRPPRDAGQG